jgi:hypothetical protein
VCSSDLRLTVSKKPHGYNDELGQDFGFVIKNAAATQLNILQIG